MLERLHRLFYDMKARGLEPDHWIVGVALELELLQLRMPWGEWVAQPGSMVRGPTIFGLTWEIDHRNPTRLELAPSPYGGQYTYDKDGSVLVEPPTPDADRLLRQVFP